MILHSFISYPNSLRSYMSHHPKITGELMEKIQTNSHCSWCWSPWTYSFSYRFIKLFRTLFTNYFFVSYPFCEFFEKSLFYLSKRTLADQAFRLQELAFFKGLRWLWFFRSIKASITIIQFISSWILTVFAFFDL